MVYSLMLGQIPKNEIDTPVSNLSGSYMWSWQTFVDDNTTYDWQFVALSELAKWMLVKPKRYLVYFVVVV